MSVSQKRDAKQPLATAGGIGAILIWSFTIALVRSISEQLGPTQGAAWVYTVGATFAMVSVLRSRAQRQQIAQLPRAYLLGCGFLFVGYTLLLFLAVGRAENRNQVLEVGLLNYLWPALTLVLSVPILGNRAKWLLLPGTILALFGVLLVVTSSTSLNWHSWLDNLERNPVAYMLGVAAALSWALYSTLTRKWAGGREGGGVVVFLPATALALFLIGLLTDESCKCSLRVAVEVVLLGTATFLAYSLWDNAMRTGNVVIVAASSYLIPLFSTAITCMYLSIVPTWRLWLGCAVLVVGSMLSWISFDMPAVPEAVQQNPAHTDERHSLV